MSDLQQKQIIASGRVQGVGFRAFVYKLALEYNIRGWVSNRSDGTVEICCQGTEKNMEDFLDEIEKAVQHGPMPALTITQQPIEEGLASFFILSETE